MRKLRDQIALDAAPPRPAASVRPEPREKRDARAGKRMLAGYFSEAMCREVAALAALNGRTVQSLIGEGIDAIAAKYGKPPFGER
jgi:hypothetical protein